MADTATTERLKAIDAKLDELNSHVLTTLTAHGERHSHHAETLKRYGTRLDKHQDEIHELKRSQAVGKAKIGFGERAWWLFASAVVGVGVYLLKGG
jgi:hypothetical protein